MASVKVGQANGDGSITIGVGRMLLMLFGLFFTILVGGTPAIMVVGRMYAHMGDTQKHEDRSTKEAHIDGRFELLIGPTLKDIEYIKEKVDDIHERLLPQQASE